MVTPTSAGNQRCNNELDWLLLKTLPHSPVAIAMFIANNLIPGRNSESSAFMFTFGGVAKQSLATLRNNLSEHPTTESTLLEEEAFFEFFLPKDVLRMNATMISCYASSCWVQFCILTDSTLGAKGYSFFPNS